MKIVSVIVLAVVFACVTWLLGWWSVPVIALAAGFGWVAMRPANVGLAAVLAWTALLALDATHGGFMALATTLGGVMTLPWLVVALVALALAFALAWGAATVGAQVRALVTRGGTGEGARA